MDFITFYEVTFGSTWISSDPGALSANLLLMGDRQSVGTKLNTGFHRRWGAGRLKMRKFDNQGLDNPYGYKTSSVCVGHKEKVTVKIKSGNVLPNDVEYVKAVIYWYDSRHDSATNPKLDDIDLKLRRTSGNAGVIRSSISGSNNMERVFYAGAGGSSFELEIYGYNVTADNAGCGQNKMRVYYAHMYEDNDRDDATGLEGIDSEY